MQAAIDLVAARYGDKVTLDDLAQAANMQRNYFCRIFRQVTGITPMEYLLQYRVQVASRLLRETESSITEIGYAIGFADASHFCRAFSRIMGTSPSRFRKC
jgi:AraC-like DNA-binding protein